MTFFSGLSGRLLILTIIVVMVVEVAIFVPSVSQFRNAYLMERIARAQIASLTLLAAPGGKVAPELEAELLDNAEVVNIVMQRDGVRQFMLSRD
ncbi:MAG: sensor histidine kinase, partial [Pseudomonadota bacterium]